MSLVIALSATPGLLGTQEAVRQAQRKESREEHRARRCNFIAHCIKSSLRAREINDRPLVLRDGRIFIDSAAQDDDQSTTNCAGYYLPYPDSPYEGLVTRISTILPIMNWVYIDVATHQLRYGVRKDAEGNMTGPFDCTSHSRRVTFQGWEGFCAVEEQPGEWAVYFDVDDDALKGKVPHGTRILEIEIERREERWKKGEHAVVPVRRNVVQTQRSENDGVQGAPSQPQTEAPITAPQEPTVPLSPTRQQVPVSKTIPQPKIYSSTAPRQAIPAPTKPPSTTQSITAPSTIQPPWPSSISTLEREYRSKSTSPSKISNSSTEPPLSPTATPKTLRHSPRSISGRHMNPPSKPTTQNKPRQIPSQQRPLSPMTHSPNSPIRTLASREMLSLFNDDERQYIEEFSTLFTNTLRPLSVSLSLSFPDSASPRRHSSSSIIRRAVRRMSTGGSSLFKSLSIGKGLGERRRTGNGVERVSRVLRRKRKTF